VIVVLTSSIRRSKLRFFPLSICLHSTKHRCCDVGVGRETAAKGSANGREQTEVLWWRARVCAKANCPKAHEEQAEEISGWRQNLLPPIANAETVSLTSSCVCVRVCAFKHTCLYTGRVSEVYAGPRSGTGLPRPQEQQRSTGKCTVGSGSAARAERVRVRAIQVTQGSSPA